MNTFAGMSTDSFADLMAELPAAVVVITTRGPAGPVGLAVTSLAAYSATPPSVMVSIAHSSRCHNHLLASSTFGVHLLHTGQEHIARTFASKVDDKFSRLSWSWHDDVPRLSGSLAYLRCHREAYFAHLDHTVIIGRIESAESSDDLEAMLYLRRKFDWRLSRIQPSDAGVDV